MIPDGQDNFGAAFVAVALFLVWLVFLAVAAGTERNPIAQENVSDCLDK